MDVNHLIKQADIDEAPSDPRLAFAHLAGLARTRLNEWTGSLDTRDEWGEQAVLEACYSFMNVVLALGKSYTIDRFSEQQVPAWDDFTLRDDRQFKADLDHFLTQIMVDNSLRRKRESVPLPEKVKDRIRSHVHSLKTAVDQAELSEARRAALHTKLAAFEAELEKPRLNVMAVTAVAMAILALPGDIWASSEVVIKLTTNVLQAVGEAKAIDDEKRELPPVEAPKVLLPPRGDTYDFGRDRAQPRVRPTELDDEIPF